MKHKILITSVGSLVGHNILESLHNRRSELFIIGTNSQAHAPLYNCDKVYLTPYSALPPSDFIDHLLDIINSEKPDLIIPARDIDVSILASIRPLLSNANTKVLVGSPNLAQSMEDKWLSFLYSKENDLPFAETLLCGQSDTKQLIAFGETFGYPLIAKPRKGFASGRVSIIMNDSQLMEIGKISDMIIQEYLGNPEKVKAFSSDADKNGLPLFFSFEEKKHSLQFFIDSNTTDQLACETIHDMKNGVSGVVHLVSTKAIEPLISRYRKAFQKDGWFGPLNVQLQKSAYDGTYKAYEYNGRFTGATAARYYLGFDELSFAFTAVNMKLDKSNFYGSQTSIVKSPSVSYIPNKDMEELKLEKVWSKH